MSYVTIGSLVLRAYPATVRADRGEEMLGTLLDAGEDSTEAFFRGSVSLVIGGCRERARENARIGAPRLIADAFCEAAVLWCAFTLVRESGLRFHDSFPTWCWVPLAAILVLALLGLDRLAGLCGVVLAGYFLHHSFDARAAFAGGTVLAWEIDRWVGPLVCFTVMVLMPRARTHEARRLVWLIPIAILVFVSQALVLPVLFFGVPLVGLILLPVDPRLATVSALLWLDIALGSTLGPVRLGLVTTPILLFAVMFIVARGRILRSDIPA